MKKAKQSEFDRGYEQGKLYVITKLHSRLRELKNSKNAADILRSWMLQNFEEYIPEFGTTEPTPYEMKFCYLRTMKYRGEKVDIFCDDYGQQFYFYYKGEEYPGGTYNPDIESMIRYVVDKDKDNIKNFSDQGFYGALCKYSNWDHTSVDFIFRGELVDTYRINKNDPDSLSKIIDDCERRLREFWSNPEFIEAERKRKEAGDLYFSEIIEKESSK